MGSIKNWFIKSKTVLTIITGVITAGVMWSQGEITNMELLTTLWGALVAVFMRLGIGKPAQTGVVQTGPDVSAEFPNPPSPPAKPRTGLDTPA